MRRVSTTSRFERRLKVFSDLHPELIEKIEYIMTIIAVGRTPLFKIHKLKGRLRECYGASITKAYRIVFVLSTSEVCFIDIGDHDDVYR